MKAVVCKKGTLAVRDRVDPTPGPNHLLLSVERCGICGSDLHARLHSDHWADLVQRAGYKNFMRPDDEVVFGHEFCGEILAKGRDCSPALRTGARVVAMPILRQGKEVDMIGYSARSNGAYAERIAVEEALTLPIPNGLSSDLAAMTEPMAVG